jgi:hypothetical protein
MNPSPGKYAEWERTIGRIQKGMTRTEAEQILGAPSSLVSSGANEIVAYRAEQIGDAVYSLRVAYTDNRVSQCYMGLELCEGDARSKSQKRSERLQLLLVVAGVAIVFLIYYWLKTR